MDKQAAKIEKLSVIENVDSNVVQENNNNLKSYAPVIEFKSKISNLNFLLRTGSSSSWVDEGVFNNEVILNKPICIQTIWGEIIANKMAEVPLFQPYNNTKLQFLISPNKLPFNGIIGFDIMQILKAQIDLHASKFIIPGKNFPIIKIPCISQECNSLTIREQHLNDEEKKVLFPDSKLTFVSSVKAVIDTKDNEPVYNKSYPYPYELKEEVDRQIKKMLDDGIIAS